MAKNKIVHANTLKVGDLVKTVAFNLVGIVVRSASHVQGVGIMTLGNSNHASRGQVIDLSHTADVSILDADFFDGDQCIFRTYHELDANEDEVKNEAQPNLIAQSFNHLPCLKRCGKPANRNSNYCTECWQREFAGGTT